METHGIKFKDKFGYALGAFLMFFKISGLADNQYLILYT